MSNQHPEICIFAKFQEKTKIPEFQTKGALLGYVCTRISKKLLFYLKTTP